MNGIIYYNRGTKCLARLLVSIYSLREHYSGPISIISQVTEDQAPYLCKKIANCFDGVDVIETDSGVGAGKNRAYIEACLCHTVSPYENTIWLDADTLVVQEFADYIFEKVEEYEFAIAQFADWKTNGKVARRIRSWKGIHPDQWLEDALDFGIAINCGVFAFNKDSSLMNDWFELTLPGRKNFIADESCCQLILPQYPHFLLPSCYNCSCKYDNPYSNETRVIHYHGQKHCRIRGNDILYNGELWLEKYHEVIREDLAEIKKWQPLTDVMLKKYMRRIGWGPS